MTFFKLFTSDGTDGAGKDTVRFGINKQSQSNFCNLAPANVGNLLKIVLSI